MLTEKQKTFFEKLKELYGQEILPSFEIIAKEFGFKHKNSVWQYFNKLKEENLIYEKITNFILIKIYSELLFQYIFYINNPAQRKSGYSTCFCTYCGFFISVTALVFETQAISL